LQIDWRDPWLAVLLTFHIAITMTALMTRNHANFQIILFLVLRKYDRFLTIVILASSLSQTFSVSVLLVYFSESINEVAATNWMYVLFSCPNQFLFSGFLPV